MKIRVGHVEIPADDPSRATRFYEQAFGWKVTPLSRTHSYGRLDTTLQGEAARATGSTIGGLLERGAWQIEHPLVMLHVEDASLDECLRRIVAAGGSAELSPRLVGDLGEYAQFRDTEGNLFGLWGHQVPTGMGGGSPT
jgi:uncharacterized protein